MRGAGSPSWYRRLVDARVVVVSTRHLHKLGHATKVQVALDGAAHTAGDADVKVLDVTLREREHGGVRKHRFADDFVSTKTDVAHDPKVKVVGVHLGGGGFEEQLQAEETP